MDVLMTENLKSLQQRPCASPGIDCPAPHEVLVVGVTQHIFDVSLDHLVEEDWKRAPVPSEVQTKFRHQCLELDPAEPKESAQDLRRRLGGECHAVLVCMQGLEDDDFTRDVLEICETAMREREFGRLMLCVGLDDFVGATLRGFMCGPA